MIWKPGDCYSMTVPLHTAGPLSPKCRVDAGLGAGRQPDWILNRISGKEIVEAIGLVPKHMCLPRIDTLKLRGTNSMTVAQCRDQSRKVVTQYKQSMFSLPVRPDILGVILLSSLLRSGAPFVLTRSVPSLWITRRPRWIKARTTAFLGCSVSFWFAEIMAWVEVESVGAVSFPPSQVSSTSDDRFLREPWCGTWNQSSSGGRFSHSHGPPGGLRLRPARQRRR